MSVAPRHDDELYFKMWSGIKTPQPNLVVVAGELDGIGDFEWWMHGLDSGNLELARPSMTSKAGRSSWWENGCVLVGGQELENKHARH